MSLILQDTYNIIDRASIKPGDLISLKRANEAEYKNGFVARVTEYEIIATLADGLGGCTFVTAEVEDIASGLWCIRWSSDLVTVYEYGTGGTDETGCMGDAT